MLHFATDEAVSYAFAISYFVGEIVEQRIAKQKGFVLIMNSVEMLARHQAHGQMIHASWRRCQSTGLQADIRMRQVPLGKVDLRESQEKSRQLCRYARAEMRLLEHALTNAGRIVILADENGLVLEAQGDTGFLGRARRVALMPGAVWAEEVSGTNAIGTSLIEHRFTQVIGTQHFVKQNRFLACHAMPILSPSGSLAGVLDISGNATEGFAQAARLIRHAVAHIEHEWTLDSATQLLVRLHPHPSWLHTPEEGLMNFEDGVLVAASSRALAYVGLMPSAIGQVHWNDLFKGPIMYGRQEMQLQQQQHTGCYAEVSRVRERAASLDAQSFVPPVIEKFDELKNDVLRSAITEANGNVSAAARMLGVHRSTFYRRLKEL